MTIITQKFNPPLRICKKNCHNVCLVSERKWTTELSETAQTEDVLYIGSMQTEEVWKHYHNQYYISNYGYVVEIKAQDKEKAERIIPESLKAANEESAGVRWADFSNELKNLFRENALVPQNRKDSGCQICLNITGNTPEYDIHRLVARFFLEKPKDENQYVVHHIDNNSYNNHVSNLIYLPSASHQGEEHKVYHPMSRQKRRMLAWERV